MTGVSKTYYLLPGAMYVSVKPMLVTTILGSCISVCLWDRRKNFGGINHYMLPHWNGHGLASPKYGNIAIDKLIGKMLNLGSLKQDLIAKIFGGAEIYKHNSKSFNIGEQNIAFAQTVIRSEGIPVMGQSTGGNLGRKIIFNTANGEIHMKYVRRTEQKKISHYE